MRQHVWQAVPCNFGVQLRVKLACEHHRLVCVGHWPMRVGVEIASAAVTSSLGWERSSKVSCSTLLCVFLVVLPLFLSLVLSKARGMRRRIQRKNLAGFPTPGVLFCRGCSSTCMRRVFYFFPSREVKLNSRTSVSCIGNGARKSNPNFNIAGSGDKVLLHLCFLWDWPG